MRYQEYLSLWGSPALYSTGMNIVMADRQIKRGMEDGTVTLNEIGNAKAIITHMPTGKWFLIAGGWGNDDVSTMMLGAICGDVAGSVYERNNIKFKLSPEYLIHNRARFTDDTVMTCAVASGLRNGLGQLPDDWMNAPENEELLCSCVQDSLIRFGNRYPYAGYGGRFRRWLRSADPQPYNSWGNGSAMRASYAGWVARTLEEAEKLAEISAKVTHNHPDGINGAKVVAGSIFLLRSEADKETVRQYASQYYDLSFTLDEIRDSYSFDVSCSGSVPQAIVAFLEGTTFADVISNAISIGGDSDTIAAIAGSIAEVRYPISQELRAEVIDRLDTNLLEVIVDTADFAYRRLPE